MQNNNSKILLVGDANSIFITNYAYWLKQENNSYTIDILTLTKTKSENTQYYNSIISLTDYKFFNSFYRLKGIRRFVLIIFYFQLIKKLTQYQFIHFHFISPLIYALIGIVKHRTKAKIILTIWGSDLYRVFKIDLVLFKKACKQAHKISFTNNESLDFFKKKFNWKKPNLYECRFGLSPLENLSELKLNKTECKKELGWKHNKLAIAIGYNLSKGQQHLKIIEALANPKFNSLKNSTYLVFAISYGGSVNYKNELINAIEQSGFESVIMDQYLNNHSVAVLRKATDIMVQVQTTDQFSGSMQEHMYAGNVVITGDWLPYRKLKDAGVYFEEVSNISELPILLSELVNSYDQCEKKAINNHIAISELSRWKNTIKSWLKLYN